jgi:hypothetical protein
MKQGFSWTKSCSSYPVSSTRKNFSNRGQAQCLSHAATIFIQRKVFLEGTIGASVIPPVQELFLSMNSGIPTHAKRQEAVISSDISVVIYCQSEFSGT